MKHSFDTLLVLLTAAILTVFVQGCGNNTLELASYRASSPLVSLSITPADTSIAPGTTIQFIATGMYANGSSQNLTSSATWTSSDTGIAAISNTAGSIGMATATLSIGSTTISAVYSGMVGTTTLNTSPVSSIIVTPSSPPSIAPGTTQQFAASGILAESTAQNLTPFATWTSLNIAVATVNDATGSKGLASAVAPGTATIEAMYSGITGSAALTSSSVSSITVTPPSPSIAKGTKQQFIATGTLSDSTMQGLTTWATWTSSNTGVATISNTPGSQGLATAVAPGATVISAMFDSVASSPAATLTVTPAVLTSITVTPASKSIPLGLTQQFTATGTFSDSTMQDITTSVTWHSSSTGVASISSSGVATSAAEGKTTITASLSDITSNSAMLTVTPAALVSITVSPASATVNLSVGNTQQFAASGTFTDGSTQILTTMVKWVSTNTNVPISNTGLATDTYYITPAATYITANSSLITSNTATLTFTY